MQSACVHFAPTECVLAAAADVLAGLFLRVPLPDASFAIARAFSNGLDMRTNPKLSRAPSWTLVVYKLDWLIHQLHLYYVLTPAAHARTTGAHKVRARAMASLARSVAWGPICGIEFNGFMTPFLCARAQERAATRRWHAQKRAATRQRRPSRKHTAFGKMRKTVTSALFLTIFLLVLSALLMCMVVRKLVKSGRRDHVVVLITGKGAKGVKGFKGWQVRATSAHTRSGELATRPCLEQPLKMTHTLPSL